MMNTTYILINKSKHVIIVNNIKYIVIVGHYPKGSANEKSIKDLHDDPSDKKGLVWYCGIVSPNVVGFCGAHGNSKIDVLEKTSGYIKAGNTLVKKD